MARLLAAVLLGTFGGLAFAEDSGPRKPAAPALAPPTFSRTDVLLHTKVPLRPGRNAVWCATVQLAWDAFADAIAPGKPLLLGPPAPPADVAELNRRAFPHGDLDEASYVALGGFGRDGIVERIRQAVAAKFPTAPPPSILVGPDDAAGYARLEKDLPFDVAFHVRPSIPFAGGTSRIRAFGMNADESSEAANAMLKQLVLHVPAQDDGEEREPWNGVAELRPRGGADRIMLALQPTPATLEQAWEHARGILEKGHVLPMDVSPELVIPRIRLKAERRFPELIDAPIAGGPRRLRDAYQSTELTLTERGATLKSEAAFAAAAVPRIRFDRPFLLALLRTGATRPYLLLWVENDEVLEKAEMPPLSTAEAAPFVGAWQLDPTASLDEAVEFAAKDAPPHRTPTQAREAARKRLAGLFKDNHTTFTVAADGQATLRLDPTYGPQILVGALRRFEGRSVFVAETADGRAAPEGERIPVDVVVQDGRLRMGLPDEPATVYARR